MNCIKRAGNHITISISKHPCHIIIHCRCQHSFVSQVVVCVRVWELIWQCLLSFRSNSVRKPLPVSLQCYLLTFGRLGETCINKMKNQQLRKVSKFKSWYCRGWLRQQKGGWIASSCPMAFTSFGFPKCLLLSLPSLDQPVHGATAVITVRSVLALCGTRDGRLTSANNSFSGDSWFAKTCFKHAIGCKKLCNVSNRKALPMIWITVECSWTTTRLPAGLSSHCFDAELAAFNQVRSTQLNSINTLVTYRQNSEVATVSTQDLWTKSSQVKVGLVCIIVTIVIIEYWRAFVPWDPTYHFYSGYTQRTCFKCVFPKQRSSASKHSPSPVSQSLLIFDLIGH